MVPDLPSLNCPRCGMVDEAQKASGLPSGQLTPPVEPRLVSVWTSGARLGLAYLLVLVPCVSGSAIVLAGVANQDGITVYGTLLAVDTSAGAKAHGVCGYHRTTATTMFDDEGALGVREQVQWVGRPEADVERNVWATTMSDEEQEPPPARTGNPCALDAALIGQEETPAERKAQEKAEEFPQGG